MQYTIHNEQYDCIICSQVLLLEEDGYLGYVDGLTERRLYAPDLVRP